MLLLAIDKRLVTCYNKEKVEIIERISNKKILKKVLTNDSNDVIINLSKTKGKKEERKHDKF